MARQRPRGVLVRTRERGARTRTLRRVVSSASLAAVLAGVAFGRYALMDAERFPLRQVRIAGALEHVDRAALTAALGPVTTGGFFSVDVARVRAAAREVSWVDRAEVRRVWPDTLVVEITEQEAVARWADGALLNARGERFEVSSPPPDGLPLLAGPDGATRRVLARYRGFAQWLEAVGELRAAALDARGTWRLTLTDGVVITVREREADARIKRFAHLYATRLAGRVPPLASVDLRYADGFAVRHRAAAKPAPDDSQVESPNATVAKL